jgi:poly(hydroxyalkanoate) granule-associated protein
MKSGARSRGTGHAIAPPTKSRLFGPLIHVWLAGLGAVVKAQTEGPKLLNELINEGARVQAHKRNAAEQLVRSTLNDVQALVRRVVNELPPVRVLQEVRALRKQVDAMNASIENLTRVRRAPQKRRIKRKPRSGG